MADDAAPVETPHIESTADDTATTPAPVADAAPIADADPEAAPVEIAPEEPKPAKKRGRPAKADAKTTNKTTAKTTVKATAKK